MHKISQDKNPIVVVIAAGNGVVPWKIPYTFENEGQVYVNELSSEMVKKINSLMADRLTDNLKEKTHIIPGSCFDILQKHPELEEKIDALYVQSLEHYLNPDQHQQFLTLVNRLLAPGGRAFLAAETICASLVKKGNPAGALYWKNKEKQMYPGFMTIVSQKLMSLDLIHCLLLNVRNAFRPDDSTVCEEKIEKKEKIEFLYNIGGVLTTIEGYPIVEILTCNFFTPRIYRNSVENHKSLSIIDSFFMDRLGDKQYKFIGGENVLENTNLAAAIIEKVRNL